MTAGFFELTVVILIAAALSVLARFLKQPLILAYLATGAIIGYFGLLNLSNQDTFRIFADLGIMFLLFLVGLEINYTSLRLVGKTSLILGLAQIVFTFLGGLAIGLLFHLPLIPAMYVAIALTFSSTIIIVKLLSDKKDLNSLYGKISVGFLLVQDAVAILILILLAGLKGGEIGWLHLFLTIIKGVLLFAAIVWLGRKILPVFFDRIARSTELLFLITLSWVFVLAALASKLGFSIEIAGFLSGVALANSSEHYQIASRIRPLRDFFILIFFVILGSSLIFSDLSGILPLILVFSLFVLLGNPLIIWITMGIMGYRKRTSFLTGLTGAQISEFSLILAALGWKIGHLNESIVALITAVGVITITISTYFITYADKIYKPLSGFLSFFERKKTKEDKFISYDFKKSVVLIGYHRLGQSIALNIPKERILVVDFDPEMIEELKKQGFDYIFGDISDEEIFEKANIKETQLVISTCPDLEDNLIILEKLKNLIQKPKTIVRAENEKESEILYEKGADYVLMPHFTSGQYLGKTIAIDPSMAVLKQLKERDCVLLAKLKKRI